MNEEKQKLFKEFRNELSEKLESILSFDNPDKIPSPEVFSNSILNIIQSKYSEIYFEAEQFGNDIVYALGATGALVVHQGLYVSPQSVIREVLAEPFYIDGKLTPIAEISKAIVLKKFSQDENVPLEMLNAIFENDEEITSIIKMDIANKKLLTAQNFKVTHFPEVKAKNENAGSFH
jgi:hypothetical protein